MLVWDETDVLTVLECIPEIAPYEVEHRYSVSKDGIELKLSVCQYDGDVRIELLNSLSGQSVFAMKLIDCSGVRRAEDSNGEYLEFAPAKCFGSRYDGEAPIPYGVQIRIKPAIHVSLF